MNYPLRFALGLLAPAALLSTASAQTDAEPPPPPVADEIIELAPFVVTTEDDAPVMPAKSVARR